MPPVMGAAAFIMAEFLQVLLRLGLHRRGIIPAFLYYACLFFHVDLEAAKHNIGAANIAGGAGLHRHAEGRLALSGADRCSWCYALMYPEI